jgi:glucose-1-phosphate adenylyltransferase
MLDRGLGSRAPAYFGPAGEAVDSIVSVGCEVHGKVVNSVLAPGVYVGRNAEVRDSILLHDSRVESGASIMRCVADKDVAFGAGCRIGVEGRGARSNPMLPASAQDLTVAGKAACIGAGVELPVGAQVYPAASIEAGDPALADGELNLGTTKRPEVASW